MLDGDVIVKVVGSGELSDGERVETISQGKLYTKASGRFLVYHLVDENNPKLLIRHILKLGKSSLSVSKSCKASPALDTRFELIPGQAVLTTYNTPFGALEMAFDTKMLTVTEREDHLVINAKYNIKMGGEIISKNLLDIRVSAN